MKIFFRRIHLYLGLAAGLVIMTSCITGAILVFEKDLQMASNKDRYFVKAEDKKLSPDELARRVRDSFPDAKINSVKLYSASDRSAEINVSISSKKGNGQPEIRKAGPPARQPGFTIFINPYTGLILEKYSYRDTWFYSAFSLHRWLLGSESSIGKTITGVSTLLFVFILITGIILWWPKTKRILQQRLKIKRNAGWKRINHDLHLVFGFYSAIFLFIFAFTALAWSFEWFNNGIYQVTNSPLKAPPPPRSAYIAGARPVSMDGALQAAKAIYPDAGFYNIARPKDSLETINITALSRNAAHESATSVVYIDQYSGEVAGKMDYSERSLGARLRAAFKPIHTGSIWGTPSKIIALIVCLLGASFPVTGVIMWINRTRKKNRAYAGALAVPEEEYAD